MSLIYKLSRSGKTVSNYKRILSCLRKQQHSSSSSSKVDPEDVPIKYTTSPANKWKAEYTRTGSEVKRLSYEPITISVCLGIFMIYFFILREENDLDEIFDVSLYDRIEGLEEQQLRVASEQYKMLGMDSTELDKRIKEIDAAK